MKLHRCVSILVSIVLAAACSNADDSNNNSPVASITIPTGVTHAGLLLAVTDIDAIWRTGNAGQLGASIVVTIDDKVLGPQEYRLLTDGDTIRVESSDPIGASYGLYHIAWDLGARWYHPEEVHIPDEVHMLRAYLGEVHGPSFQQRGFHEHTQHPTVWSDFYMRPNEPGYREKISNYLKWLLRNRQNTASYHMLNTVNLSAWSPWMAATVEEAHSYGIEFGVVTSFADQQQNNFKLIADVASDSTEQIVESLDIIARTGVDFITFQIGTSEFTKPSDTDVLSWLQLSVDYLADEFPDTDPWAWIHITCDLEADSGGKFFHLPLQADPRLGAWVHTTMYYTLTDPAPVYECEDFTHQVDFLQQANGTRPQTFFPETAWWLGFDNNMPLVLPVTGLSRQRDIQTIGEYDVTGHITFTTGREWTFWMYDHYLMAATWDRTLTWSGYLDKVQHIFGESGPVAMQTVQEWTSLQDMHFYNENPLIFFYLAGELPQDEAGAQAGVIARRPKIPFSEVYAYSAEEFAQWEARDYAMLERMLPLYSELLQQMPVTTNGTEGQRRLYQELYRAYSIYVARIEHALALYGAVIDLREGATEAALQKLAAAQDITTAVLSDISVQELQYRYDDELLILEKPESLTAYPYGYLWETHTGFFWTRRDDQLAALISEVTGSVEESWANPPETLYISEGDSITLIEPNDPLIGGVLAGFVPRMLFGITDGSGKLTLMVGQDRNVNNMPDSGSELVMVAQVTDEELIAAAASYVLQVYDNTGNKLADLQLYNPEFTFSYSNGSLGNGSMATAFDPKDMVDIVVSIAGIQEDGVASLLKSVFGLPEGDPLPDRLDVTFAFATTET